MRTLSLALLVPAVMAQASEQSCACTQHEPAYPFTINCTDIPAINAAMLTLESDDCLTPRSDTFEWGGTFATPADAYTWKSQAATDDSTVASGKRYADLEMMIVAFSASAGDVTTLFSMATAANTLMTTADACPSVTMPPTGMPTFTPTATGACYTIVFPNSSSSLVDFNATVNTAGVSHVAFFTAHMPTEFERDMHYFMSTDLLTDIEPIAQDKEYCKIQADSTGFMKCQQAFYIIQSHHDYCDHDTLTTYQESLFHEWESKCDGCLIRRNYDPSLNMCPSVDCTDAGVAEVGYAILNANCKAADSTYVFEWAANFDTPADSYRWVSQAATANASFDSGYQYADAEMMIVAFSLTGNQMSALYALQPAADSLMQGSSCTRVTMDMSTGTPTGPTITPTVSGACYTIVFPSNTSIDFVATVATTGMAHVAFFTAHVPTEFERDETAGGMHYFVTSDLQNDIEPVESLGMSASHDHGRRLSVATKGSRAATNSRSIQRRGRRMAAPGECCRITGDGQMTAKAQQGAWELVVAYHDLCSHDQVPEEIEVGFHDYEASCENYFCNLVGPDAQQTVCPAPPSPPSTGMSDGALAGISVASVLAGVFLITLLFVIMQEKAGKPIFTSVPSTGVKVTKNDVNSGNVA